MGKRSREKKERKGAGEVVVKEKEINSPLPTILKTIIFLGTGLILFTPFMISNEMFFPFVGFKSIYFMALAEIIFAAWLLLIIFVPKYRPRFNALLAALVLYLAVLFISSFLGVDFSNSFWSKFERMTGILMQLHLFAFFLVISSSFKKKSDWLLVFGVSVFAAFLMSVISLVPQIAENVMGKSMADAARGGALLGNSSFLGTYLLFNFFLAIYLFINIKNGLKYFVLTFGVLLVGVALYLSEARAAFLATLAGFFLIFILWLAFATKGKIKYLGIFLLTVSVILGLAFVFYLVSPQDFLNKP